MTERRRYKPYAWEPLTMTPIEVAEAVFRRSVSWFMDHCPPDFPAQVDGLYATEAVREWVRQKHGLAPSEEGSKAATARMMARLANGKGAGALPRRAAS